MTETGDAFFEKMLKQAAEQGHGQPAAFPADLTPSGRFSNVAQADFQAADERQEAAEERAAENRLKTGRHKILNGLRRGDSIYLLMILAAKEISKATKDKDFFREVLELLADVYGRGTFNPAAMRAVRESKRKALQLRRNAYKGKFGSGAKGAIGNAIRAMQAELNALDADMETVTAAQPAEYVKVIEELEKIVGQWKDDLEEGQGKPYEQIREEVQKAEAAADTKKPRKKAPEDDENAAQDAELIPDVEEMDLLEEYAHENDNTEEEMPW